MKIAVLQIVIAFPRSIKYVVYISSHRCRAAICLRVWLCVCVCGGKMNVEVGGEGDPPPQKKKKVLDLFQEPAQVIML